MKPDYEREGIQLFCADCMDVLPHLSGVDAVVTDPPYGISKAVWDKRMPIDWFGIALDLVGSSGAIYVFGPSLGSSRFQCYWESLGVEFTARPVWVYQDGPRHQRTWTSKHEDVLVYHAPKHIQKTPKEPSIHKDKRWGDDRLIGDVWERARVLGNYLERTDHPTQKPIALMEIPVSACGDTILDPFMGSGTTGVACINTGRKFIGIEREPKYFEIAVKRIEDALNAPKQLAMSGA